MIIIQKTIHIKWCKKFSVRTSEILSFLTEVKNTRRETRGSPHILSSIVRSPLSPLSPYEVLTLPSTPKRERVLIRSCPRKYPVKREHNRSRTRVYEFLDLSEPDFRSRPGEVDTLRTVRYSGL